MNRYFVQEKSADYIDMIIRIKRAFDHVNAAD
jgi:hypothetical protein